MDDPRLRWLRKHWKKTPPVHVALAAFLGIGENKNQEAAPLTDTASAILGDLLASNP